MHSPSYVTGFQHQFPMLFGDDWSGAHFVMVNMSRLAVVLAALRVIIFEGATGTERVRTKQLSD
jgi:hypothetical protein